MISDLIKERQRNPSPQAKFWEGAFIESSPNDPNNDKQNFVLWTTRKEKSDMAIEEMGLRSSKLQELYLPRKKRHYFGVSISKDEYEELISKHNIPMFKTSGLNNPSSYKDYEGWLKEMHEGISSIPFSRDR